MLTGAIIALVYAALVLLGAGAAFALIVGWRMARGG